jgi:hypothetical protein
MMQRVYLQILDNPFEDLIYSELTYDDAVTNNAIVEELRNSLDFHFPSMVLVEYIDLFLEEDNRFTEVRELLSHGIISLPVILINGKPVYHGGISHSIILEEIEKLFLSGPIH